MISRRNSTLAIAGIALSAIISVAPAHAEDAPRVKLATSMGDIVVELDAQKAPKSVANFVQYVKAGHYTNTVFHRVIDSFMIQGGGMTADMKQKETQAPIENEAKNGLKNDKYTVAMARTQAPHSATAQFFINVADNDFLNFTAPTASGWGYAVFGKVVSGMSVIDKIAKVATGDRAGMNEPVRLHVHGLRFAGEKRHRDERPSVFERPCIHEGNDRAMLDASHSLRLVEESSPFARRQRRERTLNRGREVSHESPLPRVRVFGALHLHVEPEGDLGTVFRFLDLAFADLAVRGRQRMGHGGHGVVVGVQAAEEAATAFPVRPDVDQLVAVQVIGDHAQVDALVGDGCEALTVGSVEVAHRVPDRQRVLGADRLELRGEGVDLL